MLKYNRGQITFAVIRKWLVVPFYLSLALVFSLKSYGQTSSNDLKKLNLISSVKSLRLTSYYAINSYGKIIKGKREAGFHDGYDNYSTFNNKGNLVEKILFNQDGSLDIKITCKYNNDNLLIEENIYNSDESISSYNINKYDLQGRLLEMIGRHSDGSLFNNSKYEYDNNGNMIASKTFFPNSSNFNQCFYKYDDKHYSTPQN